MKRLASNQQLYEYLGEMESALRERGAEGLARTVAYARKHAVGSSTEFLGESRIALRQVTEARPGLLTATEGSDLTDVLRDLDEALDRR
jgi:hypothetical protein